MAIIQRTSNTVSRFTPATTLAMTVNTYGLGEMAMVEPIAERLFTLPEQHLLLQRPWPEVTAARSGSSRREPRRLATSCGPTGTVSGVLSGDLLSRCPCGTTGKRLLAMPNTNGAEV